MAKGYAAPTWMTYKQARELKGQVRKSEDGSRLHSPSTLNLAALETELTQAATGKAKRAAALRPFFCCFP
jgi:antirestriction protein ArdC